MCIYSYTYVYIYIHKCMYICTSRKGPPGVAAGIAHDASHVHTEALAQLKESQPAVNGMCVSISSPRHNVRLACRASRCCVLDT